MTSRRRTLSAACAVIVTCSFAAAATSAASTSAAATPAVTAATAAASTDTSLLGEWHMDELDPNSDGPASTPDSSGNGDYLMVANPTQVPGRFGNAFSFNAAKADKLYTPGSGLQPAQITTMAWVKGSASPGNYKAVVAQGGEPSCSIASYALYTGANGGISFYIAKNTSTTFNSASADPKTIWDGKWHAVAGTYDGSNVRLYVDGTQVGSPTPASGVAVDYAIQDNEFEVGNYVGCTGSEYTGAIDEVRVYNRALNAAEVGEIQSGTATTPPELGADPTSTQVNCMPMSAAVGATVACTAMVSDTAAADATAPTGTVTFASDSPGAFNPAAATCTLGSPQGAISTCSVDYSASAVGSGSHHITGAFTSDASDTTSEGTATLTVTSGPTGAPGPTAPTAAPAPAAPAITPVQAVFSVGKGTVNSGAVPVVPSAATPVTFNAGATTGASNLLWAINNKPVASCNAATPNLTVHLAQAAKVSLTAFGPGGSARSSQSVAFAGHLLPTNAAAFLQSTAVCSGGSPTVDVTANGGPPAGCSSNVIAGIVSAVGCLDEVTDPAVVPRAEGGILNAMIADYQDTPAALALGHSFNCSSIAKCSRVTFGVSGDPNAPVNFKTVALPVVQVLGLYLARSTVRINGVDFTPLNGASIAVSPGMSRIVSSDALVSVKGVPIQLPGPVNLDVKTSCTPACGNNSLQIATFDSRNLPGLSGADFPFTGTASIAFVVHGTDRYSEITGHIELPPSLGGITVDAKLRVDNTNGITPESFHGHADNLGFDGIGITNVEVDYDAPDNWKFYGDLGIGGYEVRLAPTPAEPYNGIVFTHGSLDHAGATLDLSSAPPEIAPGVSLEKIGLSFSTNPSAVRGSITLNALGLADVTGNLVLAFPSSRSGFTPGPLDLPGAPASILNRTYYAGPLIGVGGSADVVIPDVGEVPLGQGYLLYDVGAGYIAAGGQIDVGLKDVIEIKGRVDGEFNVTSRRFNLSGSVGGCLFGATDCPTVTGVVSSAGIGICAGDWGGGFLWSDFPTPHIYGKVDIHTFLGNISIGKGCLPSRFMDNFVFDGHIAGVNAPTTFFVKRGHPLPEILLAGDTGAPNVSVTGPDGQVLTADGAGVHRGGGMIVVQATSAAAHIAQTVIGVEDNAAPGAYTITPLAGPAVIDSGQATETAPAKVSGKLTGTGTRRTLHYAVTGQMPGERITFSQVEHGVSREIGSTTGGHGTVTFTIPPGSDKRTITAQETVNGVAVANAQNLFVARFTGPGFTKPAAVGKLSAHFIHGVLTASWKPAAKAKTYQVTLREKKGGLLTLTTRRTTLRITGANATLAGVVKVVAISTDGSRGRATSTAYRAAHASTSRFLPFSELKTKVKKKA